MVNRSKQRGTAHETAVVNYLKENGYPHAERRTLNGKNDRGDVNFRPDWVLECKSEKAITLSEYMKEVEKERVNAGAEFGAAVVKAPRKPVSQAYVVLTLEAFLRLINK